MKNAIWRSGAGTPVRLTPDDFEVERTEMLTRSATVLMLDVSLSMPMRDNFLPAKKVAMALHALITSQFPRDYFGLVSFGRVAREVKPELLPEMSWDFEWGTNMQHALLLARKQLVAPERHQADHHGHRRRADRPHRGRRGLLPVPAVADHHRGDAEGGHALHA